MKMNDLMPTLEQWNLIKKALQSHSYIMFCNNFSVKEAQEIKELIELVSAYQTALETEEMVKMMGCNNERL